MLRRLSPCLLCCTLFAPGALAVEGESEPPEAAPLATTDPGLHVEARGEAVYRTRDLDALLLVTRRRLGRALREDEEQGLRRLLARILVERERLLPLLEQLPAELDAHARDELVLDLLAYRPEPAPAVALPDATPVETTTPSATTQPLAAADEGPLPPSTGGLAPPSATPPPPAPVVVETAPVAEDLIPLPPLQLSRRSRDGGTQRLAVTLALQLGASDDRELLLGKLPLFQDRFITTLHGLEDAAITSPDPHALKQALGIAARAAVPGFTGEVLITSLTDPSLQQ